MGTPWIFFLKIQEVAWQNRQILVKMWLINTLKMIRFNTFILLFRFFGWNIILIVAFVASHSVDEFSIFLKCGVSEWVSVQKLMTGRVYTRNAFVVRRNTTHPLHNTFEISSYCGYRTSKSNQWTETFCTVMLLVFWIKSN